LNVTAFQTAQAITIYYLGDVSWIFSFLFC